MPSPRHIRLFAAFAIPNLLAYVWFLHKKLDMTGLLKYNGNDDHDAIKMSSFETAPTINNTTNTKKENQNDDKTATMKTSSHRNSLLNLNVPFYVYDDNSEMNWWDNNATMQGVPLSQSWYPSFKHSDDYWFLKSALVHPMRVSNPQDAQLFFVPFLLNAVSEVKNNYTSDENGVLRPATFCVHRRCSNETNMIAWANDLLGNSTYFQRHGGRDHILVASHYHHPRELEKDTFSNLRKCSVVSFENYQKLCHKGLNRCLKLLEMPKPRLLQVDPEFLPNVSLPSLYVGRPCQQHYHHYSQNTTITRTTTSTRNLQSNNGNDNKNDNNNNNNSHKKTADFAMVASMMGKPIRQKLCRWLDDAAATATDNNQSYYNFSTSLCGEGPQCPALAQARYGFHVQGDSHGSNRPMDTLLSATIPIFTNEAQYNILPDFYYYHDDHNRRSSASSSSLWRQVSFFVPLSTSFSNFSQALHQILEQPDSVYEEKMELIAKYRDWFDYSSGVPFDKYMAEFARRILPLQY